MTLVTIDRRPRGTPGATAWCRPKGGKVTGLRPQAGRARRQRDRQRGLRLRALTACWTRSTSWRREAGEDGLEDLGHELLPRLVDSGEVCEHRFDGYWRDVGTIPPTGNPPGARADEPPIDLDEPGRRASPTAQGQPRAGADPARVRRSLERDRARRDVSRACVRAQRDRTRRAGWRRARWCGSPSCCRAASCAPGRGWSARSSTTASRSLREAWVWEPDGEIALVGLARRGRRGRAAGGRRVASRRSSRRDQAIRNEEAPVTEPRIA